MLPLSANRSWYWACFMRRVMKTKHSESKMTQPNIKSTAFISIHNRRRCYLKKLGRAGLILGLVIATLTAWQTAWAGRPTTTCEPTMTQYRGEVYFDDSPPCLQFGTESVSSATVWNMCDVDVIVTQVVGFKRRQGRRDNLCDSTGKWSQYRPARRPGRFQMELGRWPLRDA